MCFPVPSVRKHTRKRTLKPFLCSPSCSPLTPLSALSPVSPSHTYGTQSQHLQPGFPPIWRVCSLGFPGHKHQGETPLSTLALPGLGRQWNQDGESHPRGWALALQGPLPEVLQNPWPPTPAPGREMWEHWPDICTRNAQLYKSSFQTPVILGCNDLEVLRAPLCSWPSTAL